MQMELGAIPAHQNEPNPTQIPGGIFEEPAGLVCLHSLEYVNETGPARCYGLQMNCGRGKEGGGCFGAGSDLIGHSNILPCVRLLL